MNKRSPESLHDPQMVKGSTKAEVVLNFNMF